MTVDVWTCPECGARLVTRNMWHSCGRHSLDELFPGDPARLALAQACVRLLTGLGDIQVMPQKTRLVCVARVRFAGLYPRRGAVLLSFALRRWLDSPRIVRREDYGPGWRAHVVRLTEQDDLDDELRGWLQESHDTVGLQRG